MTDEEWHKNVEEHLLRDLIEDLQDRIKEHDIILKGEKKTPGLLTEYTRHDELIRRMYSIIWQDATGQKGLLHDIDVLMGRAASREKKWQAWSAIIVALIMSATNLVMNWDRVQAFLDKEHISLGQHSKHKKQRKQP